MRKRIVNIVVFLALAAVITWVLSRIKETVKPLEDTEYIPRSACVILRVNNLSDFIQDLPNSNVWGELSKVTPFNGLQKQLTSIDSIFLSNRSLSDIYDNTKLYLSIHVIGKNNPDYMYRFVFSKSFNEKHIFQKIEEIFGNGNEPNSRKYEGQEIYDISDANGNSVSYSFFKNQLFITSSAIILENVLRQDKIPVNSNTQTELYELLNTAGKTVSANLIYNHKELAKYFEIFARSPNSYPFTFFESFSDWSVLDLNFNKNTLLANGFTNATDSQVNYLSVFEGQESSKADFIKIAPSNTKMFLSLNISNTNLFFENYAQYLKENSKDNEIQESRKSIQSKYQVDLKKFYDLFEKEIVYLQTDFKLNNYNENIFALCNVQSQSGSKDYFKEAIKKYAKATGNNANTYFQSYKIDNSTKYDIFKLPIEKFLPACFGQLFNGIENPFLAFLDNYVVFANSKNALEKFIHFNILGKTLHNDLGFEKVDHYYSSNSNIHFYLDLPGSLDIISKTTNDETVTKIRDNVEVFNKIPVLGLQYNNSSDFTFSSIFLNYFTETQSDAHTLWETLLDTSILFKPTFVKNHYTDENEIFVQDLKNNIYLVNKVGRVLWKLRLNEQIMGDVYQVDYYKNGKLQLLFSTKSQLHLVDRNGNYVERYPVNLRSDASAPLSLFDYDGDKNYRLFISTVDKRIYVYNMEGNIIDGWNFNKTERSVTSQVNHYRIGDKDYIVLSDGLRTYILNRRGEIRVPNNVVFQKSKNNNFVFEDKTSSNEPRFAVTDTSGQVWFFYFDGKHTTKTFREFSSQHYFDFQDINADGSADYIFLDKKELHVYDQRTEKELFTYKFKNEITLRPVYFHFSFTDRKLGVTDIKENKVYLINNDGSLYQGFPLQGNSLYSIGKLTSSSRFNLIVGNNNNFLLNYSVQ